MIGFKVIIIQVFSLFQEALQFYDTPRNVREAIEAAQSQGGAFTGPMGNYDTPQAGALPVFRKPCGCVLKLTSDHQGLEPETQVLTWVSVSDQASDVRGTSETEEELKRRQKRQLDMFYKSIDQTKETQLRVDLESRKHHDTLLPSQKSPLPHNRWEIVTM